MSILHVRIERPSSERDGKLHSVTEHGLLRTNGALTCNFPWLVGRCTTATTARLGSAIISAPSAHTARGPNSALVLRRCRVCRPPHFLHLSHSLFPLASLVLHFTLLLSFTVRLFSLPFWPELHDKHFSCTLFVSSFSVFRFSSLPPANHHLPRSFELLIQSAFSHS